MITTAGACSAAAITRGLRRIGLAMRNAHGADEELQLPAPPCEQWDGNWRRDWGGDCDGE